MSGRWLTLIGIGEDGVDGLPPRSRHALCAATILYGGKRHLDLVAPLIAGKDARVWPSPFQTGIDEILALAGQPVAVLASGDPMHHGVGASLARHVGADAMEVLPHLSAFSLAAARMGWPLQQSVLASAHGRPVAALRRHFQPGARLLVLTSDGDGPAEIAALLASLKMGGTRLSILERLGGEREAIHQRSAADLAERPEGFDPLNILAAKIEAEPDAPILPRMGGLPDDFFDHDGQITKRPVRALTLSALAPRAGETLWDVGAGSGSVAIEWMLADPACRALAIERHGERARRIARNAQALGVPDLRVETGTAPEALAGLPKPDAVFIGGGGADPALMAACMDALGAGGRLVANAVTLQTEAALAGHYERHGGEMTRLQIAEARPVGAMTGWRPAMPITQWRWVKR